jgi:hypothetical protein
MRSYTDSGAQIRRLQTQVPVLNLTGVKHSETYFGISIPGNRHILEIRIYGGSGDTDLYARIGANQPIYLFQQHTPLRG